MWTSSLLKRPDAQCMYPRFRALKAWDTLAFPTPSARYVYRVVGETDGISFAISQALSSLIDLHPWSGNAGIGSGGTEILEAMSL